MRIISVTLQPEDGQNRVLKFDLGPKLIACSSSSDSNTSTGVNDHFVVGRRLETGIRDLRVSRDHCQLWFQGQSDDNHHPKLTLRATGKQGCFVNDSVVKSGSEVLVKTGDKIALLRNEIVFEVEAVFKKSETVSSNNESPKISTCVTKKRIYEEVEPEVFSDRDTKVTENNEMRASTIFNKRSCNTLSDYFKKSPTKKAKQIGQNERESVQKVHNDSNSKPENNVVDFKPKGEWCAFGDKWHGFYYKPKLDKPSREGQPNPLPIAAKVAAFDIDGTLITTKSGKKFAVDDTDWQLLYWPRRTVIDKMAELVRSGFVVAAFTNQHGIQLGKGTQSGFQKKCTDIMTQLNIEMFVFVATHKDMNRKPRLGSWNTLCGLLTHSEFGYESVDIARSLYVGDAAGRPLNPMTGKSKDFRCTDRLFALNIGLKFYTPEEFFLGQSVEKFVLPEFNPKKLVENAPKELPEDCLPKSVQSGTKEVVLCVGFPASGKSTLAKIYKECGYTIISRDLIGSSEKTVKTFTDCLSKSNTNLVFIDNTNPDKASRSKFISVARSKNIPVRCLIMDVTEDHSLHNELFRSFTRTDHKPLPYLATAKYKKSYEPPTLDEGFSTIVTVPFVPNFENEKLKELYSMYLLEK